MTGVVAVVIGMGLTSQIAGCVTALQPNRTPKANHRHEMKIIIIRHCEDPADEIRVALYPDKVEAWVEKQKAAEWDGRDRNDPDDVEFMDEEFDFDGPDGYVAIEAEIDLK